MNELYNALIGGALALIPAAVALALTWLRMRRQRLETESIRSDLNSIKSAIENSDNDYYIICPVCGERVYLKKVDIEVDAGETYERKQH